MTSLKVIQYKGLEANLLFETSHGFSFLIQDNERTLKVFEGQNGTNPIVEIPSTINRIEIIGRKDRLSLYGIINPILTTAPLMSVLEFDISPEKSQRVTQEIRDGLTEYLKV